MEKKEYIYIYTYLYLIYIIKFNFFSHDIFLKYQSISNIKNKKIKIL